MDSKVEGILRLEVPIVVVIGETEMPTDAVLALTPGSIVELPKSAEEELELRVNNKPVGSGVAFKIGENFGIKLSFVGDVRTRIEALGPVGVAIEKDEEEPISDEDAEALADEFVAAQAEE